MKLEVKNVTNVEKYGNLLKYKVGKYRDKLVIAPECYSEDGNHTTLFDNAMIPTTWCDGAEINPEVVTTVNNGNKIINIFPAVCKNNTTLVEATINQYNTALENVYAALVFDFIKKNVVFETVDGLSINANSMKNIKVLLDANIDNLVKLAYLVTSQMISKLLSSNAITLDGNKLTNNTCDEKGNLTGTSLFGLNVAGDSLHTGLEIRDLVDNVNNVFILKISNSDDTVGNDRFEVTFEAIDRKYILNNKFKFTTNFNTVEMQESLDNIITTYKTKATWSGHKDIKDIYSNLLKDIFINESDEALLLSKFTINTINKNSIMLINDIYKEVASYNDAMITSYDYHETKAYVNRSYKSLPIIYSKHERSNASLWDTFEVDTKYSLRLTNGVQTTFGDNIKLYLLSLYEEYSIKNEVLNTGRVKFMMNIANTADKDKYFNIHDKTSDLNTVSFKKDIHTEHDLYTVFTHNHHAVPLCRIVDFDDNEGILRSIKNAINYNLGENQGTNNSETNTEVNAYTVSECQPMITDIFKDRDKEVVTSVILNVANALCKSALLDSIRWPLNIGRSNNNLLTDNEYRSTILLLGSKDTKCFDINVPNHTSSLMVAFNRGDTTNFGNLINKICNMTDTYADTLVHIPIYLNTKGIRSSIYKESYASGDLYTYYSIPKAVIDIMNIEEHECKYDNYMCKYIYGDDNKFLRNLYKLNITCTFKDFEYYLHNDVIVLLKSTLELINHLGYNNVVSYIKDMSSNDNLVIHVSNKQDIQLLINSSYDNARMKIRTSSGLYPNTNKAFYIDRAGSLDMSIRGTETMPYYYLPKKLYAMDNELDNNEVESTTFI